MVNLRFGHGVSRKNPQLSPRLLTELIENVRAMSNSTQATPEPKQDSNVPEINHSQAGFIGLLVGLSAIILICCGLVYYLLRTHPRKSDSARGLYARTKGTQPWEQQNDAFASDSDDDDDFEKKKFPRRDRNLENKFSTGQTRNTTTAASYDDPFDPDKIQASVQKPGSAVPPAHPAF